MLIILLALLTPTWFALRIARHHVTQRRNLRAWDRHLNG
jgi:hypothetical protein